MTQHYHIVWPDGRKEVAASEAVSTDAYAMERWGQNTAADVHAMCGAELSETTVEVSAEAMKEEVDRIATEEASAAVEAIRQRRDDSHAQIDKMVAAEAAAKVDVAVAQAQTAEAEAVAAAEAAVAKEAAAQEAAATAAAATENERAVAEAVAQKAAEEAAAAEAAVHQTSAAAAQAGAVVDTSLAAKPAKAKK